VTEASDFSRTTPDRWLALSVETVTPLESELLVEGLLGLGGRGVQEVEGGLITYVPAPADPEAFVRVAREQLLETTGLDHIRLTWRWQEHRDWSVLWRQGLGPRTITDRLIVTPSWCEAEAPEGAVVATIDPGMAFGTAEHETTRGSLRLMDRAVASGEKLLDVGCGSAVLAISAVLLGARDVLAVDIDPYACEAARENVALNGVAPSVRIEEVAVSPDWLRGQDSFDGILANIQTKILVPLLEGFASVLNPRGWLVLSGITENEWPEVIRSAEQVGFELEDVDAEGEWRSGWFTQGGSTHRGPHPLSAPLEQHEPTSHDRSRIFIDVPSETPKALRCPGPHGGSRSHTGIETEDPRVGTPRRRPHRYSRRTTPRADDGVENAK
jgi:ribosomal protein L11 methyltransferase